MAPETTHPLRRMVAEHKSGRPVGSVSICSAHPFVMQAALVQARTDGTDALIEATCNQVNQEGGYTGLTPAGFARQVHDLARDAGCPPARIMLGGDHLGPAPWRHQPAASAMAAARAMVADYVQAGFTKIHLDASMRCADDRPLADAARWEETVAERAAQLCEAAETALAAAAPGRQPPVYVIGTEVPAPGGVRDQDEGIHVTAPRDLLRTLETTRAAFVKRALEGAWERVIAVVVQPGVEFGDLAVTDYDPQKARPLARCIEAVDGLVFEAHSTDYQTPPALARMVRDHFAILKVGPQLTFALREALLALERIECELLEKNRAVTLSGLRRTLELVMTHDPVHWREYYHGDEADLAFARIFSRSDRWRYYAGHPFVRQAVDRLLRNLAQHHPPLTLLSQYLPMQHEAMRSKIISRQPIDIILYQIMHVIRIYTQAVFDGVSIMAGHPHNPDDVD